MNIIRWLIYFFSEAFQNIRSNTVTSAVTVVTISISLSICGLFFAAFVNINVMLANMSGQIEVTAYIRKDLSDEAIVAVKQEINNMPEIERLEFISKDRALSLLKDDLKGQRGIIEGLSKNPLPASFEIRVRTPFRHAAGIKGLVEKLRSLDGVEDVQYGHELIERFFTFIQFVEIFTLVIGGFLLIATLFIVSNTIRLAIYTRREEMEIMGLIGATNAFIKTPFLIEGVAEGIAGSLLSLGILAAGRSILLLKTPKAFLSLIDPPFSALYFSLGIVGSGIILGLVGSLLSFRKFPKS